MGITLVMLACSCWSGPSRISPELNGAHRWLAASLQPSEVCKLVLVLYVADWLSQKGQKVRDLTYGLIPFGIVMGIVAFLVMRQPDMGTTDGADRDRRDHLLRRRGAHDPFPGQAWCWAASSSTC